LNGIWGEEYANDFLYVYSWFDLHICLSWEYFQFSVLEVHNHKDTNNINATKHEKSYSMQALE